MGTFKVGLIDLGYGNKGSLFSFLQNFNFELNWLNAPPDKMNNYDLFILSGVGHASQILEKISTCPWLNFFRQCHTPTLGICLGFQILFESLEESNEQPGLGFIKGSVKKLEFKYLDKNEIPHMGWSTAQFKPHLFFSSNEFYFAHSYAVRCEDTEAENILASTYGFVSVAQNKNFLGCQFHPELSSEAGYQFMKQVQSWAKSFPQ